MANAKKTRAALRASDKALEVMPRNSSLSAKERAEVSRLQAEAIKADTEAALARPSEPTPNQLKALKADSAARDRLKLNRPSPVTKQSSSEFLAAEGKKIKPLKSERLKPPSN